MSYRPASPFTTALFLLQPTRTKALGVNNKTYPEPSAGELIYGSFKTYGGTRERTADGVVMIEDTAIVETWYRPDIRSDSAVALAGTGAVYEVIGVPENIEERSQFMRFTVRRFKGGA